MPITPPTRWREEFLPVVADESHLLHGPSNFLITNYFNEDQFGQKIVRAGLIVAQLSDGRYTPWSAANAYGHGSLTAFGVLQDPQDVTYDTAAIAPITHGQLVEAHCYVYGATTKGSIPAAVKTALDDIQWK